MNLQNPAPTDSVGNRFYEDSRTVAPFRGLVSTPGAESSNEPTVSETDCQTDCRIAALEFTLFSGIAPPSRDHRFISEVPGDEKTTPTNSDTNSSVFIFDAALGKNKVEIGRGMKALQQKVGRKYARFATRIGERLKTKIDHSLAPEAASSSYMPTVGGAAKTTINTLLDFELETLRLLAGFQGACENVNPQQAGEALSVLTDFLKRYQTVFADLSSRTFATQKDEEDAWKGQMGEFWHPVLNTEHQTLAEKRTDVANYFHSALDRLEKVILPRETKVSYLGENAALVLGKDYLRARYQKRLRPIADFIEMLTNRTAVYQKAQMTLEKTVTTLQSLGFSFPEREETSLAAHQILVEKIGGKNVVCWCSPQAKVLDIHEGMDAAEAELLWNSFPDLPGSELIREVAANNPEDPFWDVFRNPVSAEIMSASGETTLGQRTLRSNICDTIEAVLSQSSALLRNMAYEKLLQIPYLGRPLAALCKVLFWLASLPVKGANYFIGIPSSSVLANEITNNLLTHLFNPSVLSGPFLLIDRLLSLIEAKNDETDPADSQTREAFLGELALELAKTLKTLCPSLFNLRHPRIAGAIINAALWLARKTIAGLALLVVNPLTRKLMLSRIRKTTPPGDDLQKKLFVAERSFMWMQSSAVKVFFAKDALETTHSILSEAYRTLGLFGKVTPEQSHFEQGSRSWAHLIHHTFLGCQRILTASKRAPDFVEKQFYYQRVKEKLVNGVPLDDADTQILVNRTINKHKQVVSELEAIQYQIELVRNIPEKDREFASWLKEPTLAEGRLKGIQNSWKNLRDEVKYIAETQRELTGEASLELTLMLNRINGIRKEAKELSIFFRNNYSRDALIPMGKEELISFFEKVGNLIHKQDQQRQGLLWFFEQCKKQLEVEFDAYQNQLTKRNEPATVEQMLEEYFEEAQAKAFSEPRVRMEVKLQNKLAAIDQQIEQTLLRLEQVSKTNLKSLVLLQALQIRKENFYLQHKDHIEAFVVEESRVRSFWNGVKNVANLANNVWNNFRGNATVENPQTKVLREVNFYLPSQTAALRKQYAELFADRLLVSSKLVELTSKENSKVLFKDPVWVLSQSGTELIHRYKITLNSDKLFPEHAPEVTETKPEAPLTMPRMEVQYT